MSRVSESQELSEIVDRPEVGRPAATEYAEYYETYVSKVPEGDVVAVLAAQVETLRRTLAAVPRDRERYRYADGKWSVRELVGHLIDAERVFGYRALAIARGEEAALPGMDQEVYAGRAPHHEVALSALTEELVHVRRGHVLLFRHLAPEAWSRRGVASGWPVTVRAIAYVLAGHVAHHLGVLGERYGVGGG